MKWSSVLISLLVYLAWGSVQSQELQPGGLRDRRILHVQTMVTNVPGETCRDVLTASTRPRREADSMLGIDALGVKGTSYFSPNGKFIPRRLQRSPGPAGVHLFPPSQVSVIDTAIVLSTRDTTKHLYTFNANAKRTSDVMQKWKDNTWVDTLRQTNTYDASDNMLSDWHEYSFNGQWVNWWRNTYTYDASNKVHSDLYEYWSNGQLTSSFHGTYTYDDHGNMLSESHEEWSSGQVVSGWRQTYSFDGKDKKVSVLSETWSNGQW